MGCALAERKSGKDKVTFLQMWKVVIVASAYLDERTLCKKGLSIAAHQAILAIQPRCLVPEAVPNPTFTCPADTRACCFS